MVRPNNCYELLHVSLNSKFFHKFCCRQCDITDIKCFVLKLCWKRIAYVITIILGIVAGKLASSMVPKNEMLACIFPRIKLIYQQVIFRNE